jgi:hypothetical protein
MYIATLFQPSLESVENWMCFDDEELAIRKARHFLYDFSYDTFIVIYHPNGQPSQFVFWLDDTVCHSPEAPACFGPKVDWRNEGF